MAIFKVTLLLLNVILALGFKFFPLSYLKQHLYRSTSISASTSSSTSTTGTTPIPTDDNVIPPLRSTNPLKVLLLVEPTPLTYVSGYANRFKEMLRYLKDGGDTVHIITPDETVNPPEEYIGFKVSNVKGFRFPLYKQVLCSFDFGLKTKQVIKEMKPDIIHVSTPSALVFPACLWAWWYKIPLLMSYHTNFPAYARAYVPVPHIEKLANLILHTFHQHADLTLCTSPQLAEDMISINIKKVDVWLKGINTDTFNPKYNDIEMRKKLSNNNSDAPLLVYVGRLGFEKKIQRLLKVLDAIPDARLALVGTGPYEEELKKIFEGYPQVNFIGQLSGASLSQAFASADIFMMPSDSETLGFVAIEAMASGVPVIGVAAGGLIDLIQDNVNGFLVPNGDDMTEFIEKTRYLIDNNERRVKLGKSARRWTEGFSWEAATSKLRNIQYRKAITNFEQKLSNSNTVDSKAVDENLTSIGQCYRPDLSFSL